jgi:hypothetical protein
MLTPLINGSIFLFLFILFGPGIFALGYWSLRSRDKEDKRLGAKALLAYLEALTTQAALASAGFLLWVLLEYAAGRFDTPPDGKPPSSNWKGAFGTLLLHSVLAVVFSKLLSKIEANPHPSAKRFFRGFSAYLCALLGLVSLSLLSWNFFAPIDESMRSMAYAASLCYIPSGALLSFSLAKNAGNS